MKYTDLALDTNTPPLTVYIENAAHPKLGGATLPLPITAEDLRPWLDGLEIDPQDGRGIAVKDIRTPFDELGSELSGVAFEELNYLAANIAKLDDDDRESFAAIVNSGMYGDDVTKLINAALDTDAFAFMPVNNVVEYGEVLTDIGIDCFGEMVSQMEQHGGRMERELAEHIKLLWGCVDFEKLGERTAMQDGGIFTDYGYLNVWREVAETYRTAEDIPAEQRLFEAAASIPAEQAPLSPVAEDKETEVNLGGEDSLNDVDDDFDDEDILDLAAVLAENGGETPEASQREPKCIISAEYQYTDDDGPVLETVNFPASDEVVARITEKLGAVRGYYNPKPEYRDVFIGGMDDVLAALSDDLTPEDVNELAKKIAKLDSLSQGVLVNVADLCRNNDLESLGYALDALASVTERGADLSEAREEIAKLRAPRTVDGYKVIQSVEIDGQEIIAGENLDAEHGKQYLLWHRSLTADFGRESHMLPVYNADYMAIMRQFTKYVSSGLDSLNLARVYRGNRLSDPMMTAEWCVPDSKNTDFKGKVVAIRPEIFSPEYRSQSHQLFLATGGFGCSPTARGRAVYVTNLYDREQLVFNRSEFLGVIDETKLPKWARDNLAAIRGDTGREQSAPPQYESVLAKIEEGRERQKQEKEQRRHESRVYLKGRRGIFI